MTGQGEATGLAGLRGEIDRIDSGMHALLMERGLIIDRLIATKGTAASGSAFRPEREASMMRVLAARHGGRLPLDAVEGIWRVIISTFTHVQAPFAVHADMSDNPVAMQDSARFHFGFTVPLIAEPDAGAVVAEVAGSRGDLGLVALDRPADGAWWRALEPDAAPKVIARLPFLARDAHPAGRPVLVLSKVVSEEGVGSVLLHSAEIATPRLSALREIGAEIVAEAAGRALVAVPRDVEAGRLAEAIGRTVPVGSHPRIGLEPARAGAGDVSPAGLR